MKKALLLITLPLVVFICQAQQAPTVSPPISVSGNSSAYGKHLPRISTLEDGTPVVFWSKAGSNGGLFLSRMEGDSFGPVITVPTADLNPDVWSGGLGPAFTVSGNTIFIAFEIWGEAVYLVRSTDGGDTFDAPVAAIVPEEGRVASLPAIAADTDGNPVIGSITTNYSEQDARYEVARSWDGGLTFGEPVAASLEADGEEVCECCPSNLLVTENGDIYVSFRNNNSNIRDIWITRSTDGGISFPEAFDVDQTNWSIMGCPSTGPHTIRTGNNLLNVFFSGSPSWGPGVYLSSLDLTTFTAGETIKLPYVEGIPGNQNFPRIAGNEDTLGIVWHENTGSFFKIGFAWSISGTGGLPEEASLLYDAGSPQTYADICFHGGKFHVVYEDQESGTPVYHSIDFDASTGITGNWNGSEGILVYPNPASQSINVELTVNSHEELWLEIIDLSGRVVRESTWTANSGRIDVSTLNKGHYLVRLTGGTHTFMNQLEIY